MACARKSASFEIFAKAFPVQSNSFITVKHHIPRTEVSIPAWKNHRNDSRSAGIDALHTAYYPALGAYQAESEDQRSIFLIGDENQSDRVDMDARIVSLDPWQGEGKLQCFSSASFA
jgi:hypothetical protein